MSDVNYVVHYYVCDNASMAGGNWDEVTKAFPDEASAIEFAKKLSNAHKPSTVVKEQTIKTFFKSKVK